MINRLNAFFTFVSFADLNNRIILQRVLSDQMNPGSKLKTFRYKKFTNKIFCNNLPTKTKICCHNSCDNSKTNPNLNPF